MTDHICVPVPSNPVVHVGDISRVAAYVEDENDRAVTAELLSTLAIDGGVTHLDMRGVADGLSEATREQRAALRDRLCARAGLLTRADKRYRAAQQQAQAVAAQNSGWQTCGHTGCNRMPINRVTGGIAPVNVRKWYCEEHRGEATSADNLPLGIRWARAPSGGYIDLDEVEVEQARGRAAKASSDARAQARQAEAELAAAEYQQRIQAEREQLESALPDVFKGKGA